MIVWITGPSASGKSTINYKVVESLQKHKKFLKVVGILQMCEKSTKL